MIRTDLIQLLNAFRPKIGERRRLSLPYSGRWLSAVLTELYQGPGTNQRGEREGERERVCQLVNKKLTLRCWKAKDWRERGNTDSGKQSP